MCASAFHRYYDYKIHNTTIMTDNKTPALSLAGLSLAGVDLYSAVDTGNISGARTGTMNSIEHADNSHA